jgi:hypothetical protein
MNDYLEIFSDVVLLATFQPRYRERFSPQPRIDDMGRSRPSVAPASLRGHFARW